MADDELVAREGDVLVVSYPEIKVPLTTKFASVTVGGLIYTRRMNLGDVVQVEHDKIYAFLKRNAEHQAKEKVREWTEELSGKRPPALPPLPKPAGPGAPPQQVMNHGVVRTVGGSEVPAKPVPGKR